MMKIDRLLEENTLDDPARVNSLLDEAFSAQDSKTMPAEFGSRVFQLWDKLTLNFS
jgi:hypothetical protein